MRRDQCNFLLIWTATYSLFALLTGTKPGAASSAVELEPRISPIRTEYSIIDGDMVVEQGLNIMLSCQAIKPVKWKLPSLMKIFGEKFQDLDVELQQASKVENGALANPSDGYRHVAILTVFNTSYLHTGYYTCHHVDADENDEEASDKIFVYVSGNNYEEWMAIPGSLSDTLRMSLNDRQNLVIPCRPTHPTVNITLLNGREELIPAEGNWIFDARQGFKMLTPPLQRFVTFQCQIQSWHYPSSRRISFSRSFSFNISEPASVNLRPLNQTESFVVEGGNILWAVKIDAFPNAEVKWYDSDGSTIEGSGLKRQVEYDEQRGFTTLRLIGVERFHTGQYRLEVVAEDRQKSIAFSLRVKYLPKVRIPDEIGFEKYVKQYYNLGETFSFEWAVDSDPPPEIVIYFGECHTFEFENEDFQCQSTWTLSESIQSGVKHVRYDGNNETVSVSDKRFWFGDGQSVNVTGSANVAGEYLCRACNELGCSSYAFNTRHLLIFEVHNGFDLSGLSDDAFVEDQVTLTCGISFYLYKGGISWTWTSSEGATITLNQDNLPPGSRMSVGNSFKTSYVEFLQWSSMPYTAAGVYTCRATSLQNSSEEKALEFKVLDVWMPIITVPFNEANATWVAHGKSFQLICPFDGGPIPKAEWTRLDGNKTINATVTTHKRSSVLYFPSAQAEDAGLYRCTAGNRLGKVHMDFVVGIGSHPGLITAIIFFPVVLLGVGFVFLVRLCRRNRSRRNFARSNQLDTFHSGDPENIDPDLQIVQQSHCLPYVHRWEFRRKRLTFDKELTVGDYGTIIKGQAERIRNTERVTEVMVKRAQSQTDLVPLKNLISELKILIHLGSHLNILNLLGACTKKVARGELMLICEYCRHGNLRDYMIRHRERFVNQVTWAGKFNPSGKKTDQPQQPKDEGSVCSGSSNSDPPVQWTSNYPPEDEEDASEPFRTQELMCWSFQIARGMKHLASRKVVHGDLAARNVLLADNNVVKIADFGLAREQYRNTDFLNEGKKGKLPGKWMAMETIQKKIFSSQSDVWSFGIVLWELFSLGKVPYPGMEFDDLFIPKLRDGYRMEKPRYAPTNIYSLMGSCWRLDPRKRPAFGDLEDFLGHQLEPPVRQQFLDLNEPYVKANAKMTSQTTDYVGMFADTNYGTMAGSEDIATISPSDF